MRVNSLEEREQGSPLEPDEKGAFSPPPSSTVHWLPKR